MMKGSLSNTLLPSVWIHSDVLVEEKGRLFKIGPMTYGLRRRDWLWALSYFVKPIVIYIDRKPLKILSELDSLHFSTFSECKDALRRSYRAVELIVDDPQLVCGDVVLFNQNIKRYC